MKKAIPFVLLLISLKAFASFQVDNIVAYSLKNGATESINLKKQHNPTVVIFISKDCPCSKGNLPYINQLSIDFKKFRFIGIHAKKDSKAEDVATYIKDINLNFEIYNDSDLIVTDIFKALKTPHAYIINTNGEIIYNGGITNTTSPANAKEFFLKNALNDIQNNKLPAKSETKTLGCFILR